MFVSGDIDQKDIIFCVREGMGNHSSHGHNGHSQRKGSESSMDTPGSSAFSGRTGSKKNSACLIKLFQVHIVDMCLPKISHISERNQDRFSRFI